MNRLSRCASTIAAAVFSVHAAAQEQSVHDGLAEVVVTAERTPAKARTTPLSLGVIGESEIERKGIADLHDIVGVIAGVTVPNGFSNMPQAVAIRGVGASLPAMSQAVGIYLDDVPLLRGYATALWDLPDIERIEVLRGPQGTLYGQNSSAGAVRFVTRDPEPNRRGWFAVAAGNHGAREARSYFTGRLGDGPLSASVALSGRRNDGFAYNATRRERINRLDVAQFHAKFRYLKPGGLDAVLALDGARDRSDANTTNFPLNHPRAEPRVSYSALDTGAFRRDAGGASLRLSYPFAQDMLLRSITAVRRFHDDPTVTDFGGLERQRFGLSQQVEQTALSQEIQIQNKGPNVAWTAGVMLVRDRFGFTRLSAITPLATPATVHSLAETWLETTDAGLYAQGRFALNERTGITAGLRLYYTRQTGSNGFWRATADGTPTALVYFAPELAASANGLLPRLGIDYLFSTDVFAYANLASGAKFGGFNRAAESLASARAATEPEQVRTLEAGIKLRTPDKRFNAQLALFYNDYRDYLAALANTRINDVQVNDFVLVNAGKARTYGLDVELALQLAQRTRWTMSLECLHSRFVEFYNPTGSTTTNFVGNRLPNAPPLSMGTSINHRMTIGNGKSIGLELSAQHLRSHASDVANTPITRIPSQTYLNAHLDVSTGGGWTVSLRLKNLADKSYPLLRTVIAPLGVDASYYNPPRTALLTLRRNW